MRNTCENTPVCPESFKVIGYYPCWEPDKLDKIDFSVLTHINYAFVIPTVEGTLLPLRHPETAAELIQRAHASGTRVMLVVGGWDYLGDLLEPTFAEAASTPEKRKNLADEIMELCNSFGFDGVDIDWEYPRPNTPSYERYELLMLDLAQRLHSIGKELTCAVVCGANAEGGIVEHAAGQSDKALSVCDGINIMAYDGGDGELHSTYDFAVRCGEYWSRERKLPREKLTLGLPFYARPTWTTYEKLLTIDPEAWSKDQVTVDGQTAWYNGIPTIQQKTRYAMENLGGVMIWELTQDVREPGRSLQAAIGEALGR